MRHVKIAVWAVTGLIAALIAGCGSGPAVDREPSNSAIRAAEEVGASRLPGASLYLQLAKEETEQAKVLASKGEKAEAQSMLSRAQADGELAVALSRGDADKVEAAKAVEKVRQLRQDNQLPEKGK